jgi:hypothetical protein
MDKPYQTIVQFVSPLYADYFPWTVSLRPIGPSRSLHHPETRTYLDRRISEAKTKREAMCAIKRHLSRTPFRRLVDTPLTS